MDGVPVVTCFLRNRGDVLLFLRSADAETYPGRWGTVTGYVEDDDPLGTAEMEIREETGITDADLERAGKPFSVRDEALGREWRVHPFLYETETRDVTLNEESATAEWTSPTTILRRETVPHLWRSYEAVAPSPEAVAEDVEHGSAYLSIRALEALRDAAGRAAVEGEGKREGENEGEGEGEGDRQRVDLDSVAEIAGALLDARPSMAALVNRVNRVVAGSDSPAAVERAAIGGIDRAIAVDEEAAREAARIIDGGTVLTLSRSGTVVDALRLGARAALVAESRPAREGIGVAEALVEAGLDVTLCTDAAVAHLLSCREVAGDGVVPVDAMVVGADAILSDGRVVNKTGTRAAALAADREGVPCYVVTASDKVQADDELHLESGARNEIYDGAADVDVENPTFDVTPLDLVAGVVTERGVLDPEGVAAVADEHRELAEWRREFSE